MAYSLDFRRRALVLLESGKTLACVSDLLGVSSRTLSDWKRRGTGGSLQTLYPKARGAYKINDAALLAHLKAYPDSYLEELAAVSSGTAQGVAHVCKRLGITRKKRRQLTANAMKKPAKPTLNN